ncbi:2-polyprenyl-3-methyl-6-methoxy-1,4-benzoquinone monooxygenase [Marinomonas mediterranea]|jgi:Ubiquinone biosynthesis protein COQ7|uniref:3-demethoxyubiquinol 3-hydroxylase n=1 Tax=Marinomonas mediterranea (strain ATCC 700492 / JCM 21426 / NBRC 103028 / MMB-1) TaxID=717774 RepID=F2K2D7_MARM1|nr:2-polyprenyl-3-methyl-6-methoxy-1,4-benzoquinone monooxygenase [Marinomonas mediterranea]ADZ92317.1 2-nonaprenyl-3-methyl-6-methoxy-1,4-benzoquinol hydroxylase [Marinomonas mediterranea MMB-1]WCN10269.1 2-polyprenyl-3-methyl-6-methoxy-1,4-benzoquinone monooxygenase [Marinomonas mediterranea]WCN14316.1 2-polyprenyl-3-methyl-6-methoxy-1,4-benzoquinone monooxygenase [Marinomonas mediterranea]WCN18368.1 2-polyprenyl-3-methyl-6-methoxy-1,4-benzoquinone monooxygenase [Marinomonas mediterranea MMB-
MLSKIDKAILQLDRALQTLTPKVAKAQRANPAHSETHSELNSSEIKHAAGLMRINHTGEVCAQALYAGQALTAKLDTVRDEMEHAADEEIDHLVWCEERLYELSSRPSHLNPLFYSASFMIGAGAGLISDRLSLGFVAATEDQVCLHLDKHMEALPAQDQRSRAILKQMHIDEAKHRQAAIDSGGYVFPAPVMNVMTHVSKVMTKSTYRI